jgi:hypothetical protein
MTQLRSGCARLRATIILFFWNRSRRDLGSGIVSAHQAEIGPTGLEIESGQGFFLVWWFFKEKKKGAQGLFMSLQL